MPFSWVVTDEVYGQNQQLQCWPEGRVPGHLMTVPCSPEFAITAAATRASGASALVAADAWQALSCGTAKGCFHDSAHPNHRPQHHSCGIGRAARRSHSVTSATTVPSSTLVGGTVHLPQPHSPA